MNAISSQFMVIRQDIIAQNDVLKKAASASLAPGADISRPPFSAAMASAIGDVSKLQDAAGDIARDYTMGKTNNIAGVMMAKQKASLGFELTLQVRNKLIKAYQDIMTMPV
ncbi:flagellar hook-basal body complex protein FliE [Parasphingorhabdus sp.]|uniref:flagellar hook-basal body complex protein FliE n=1 Tax=Parasphingorhabdus sp. TaxID=2709688 RepID=UPI002F950F3A